MYASRSFILLYVLILLRICTYAFILLYTKTGARICVNSKYIYECLLFLLVLMFNASIESSKYMRCCVWLVCVLLCICICIWQTRMYTYVTIWRMFVWIFIAAVHVCLYEYVFRKFLRSFWVDVSACILMNVGDANLCLDREFMLMC